MDGLSSRVMWKLLSSTGANSIVNFIYAHQRQAFQKFLGYIQPFRRVLSCDV